MLSSTLTHQPPNRREDADLRPHGGHPSRFRQLPLLRLLVPASHHRVQPDGPRGLPQLHHPLPRRSWWVKGHPTPHPPHPHTAASFINLPPSPLPTHRSRSDQPLELPSLPADLEDRPRPGRGQHGGGQAQRDDLRHGLDDVQAVAAGRYDRPPHQHQPGSPTENPSIPPACRSTNQ